MDIDGTIINQANTISAADREALKQVSKAGIPVSLCTGRSFCTSLNLIRQLDLTGFHVFFDGALVCNSSLKTLYSHPIPTDLLQSICRSAIEQDILIDLFTIEKYIVRRKSWRSQLRLEYFGIEAEVRDYSTVPIKEQIIKGTLALKESENRQKVDKFISTYASFLDFSWSTIPAYPGCHFVNILDKGVSKGKAVEALAEHYNIGMDQIMAIGDGSNDISLLSCIGTAVAMGNAPEELKKIADYVTLDVEHHGVSEIIRKLLF